MKVYAVFQNDCECSSLMAIYSNSNFAKNWIEKEVDGLLKKELEEYNKSQVDANFYEMTWEEWKRDFLFYDGYSVVEMELNNPNCERKRIYSTDDEKE